MKLALPSSPDGWRKFLAMMLTPPLTALLAWVNSFMPNPLPDETIRTIVDGTLKALLLYFGIQGGIDVTKAARKGGQ